MFADRLKLELTLTVGGDVFVVPGGSIKRFRLRADVTGFDAEVLFVVSAEQTADRLKPSFVAKTALQVSMTLEPVDALAAPKPLKLTGHATDKSLVEVVGAGVQGAPVLVRHYALRFCDAARAFWSQHRPCELHTDCSLQAVIDRQRAHGMRVRYEWSELRQARPLICLALGQRDCDASFYDFMLWLCDTLHGHFEHDYGSGDYRLGKQKDRDASPCVLLADDVRDWRAHYATERRHNVQVRNVHAELAQDRLVSVDTAVPGVRHDVLTRTPVADALTATGAREAQRCQPREHVLQVDFARFPRSELAPNRLISLERDTFSDNLLAARRSYRVVELHIAGQASGASAGLSDDLEEPSAEYQVEADARLELASDPLPNLRPFTPPRYPIYVEGTIVSHGGQDDDRTWLTAEDPTRGPPSYRVQVPLWNAEIPVPAEPGLLPGHFFFPAYKHARVRVALGFDAARISGFVDWAPGARVPQTGQGNRLALGKRDADGVKLTHHYQGGKPVLELRRVHGADVQTLLMKEGTIRLEVSEKRSKKKTEPRFDVTLRVEAAKSKLDTKVKGSVGDLARTFEGASGKVTTCVSEATTAVEEALVDVESALTTRAATVRAEVEALTGTLEQSLDALSEAVLEAKSELSTLLAGMFAALLARVASLEGSVASWVAQAQAQLAGARAQSASIEELVCQPLERLRDRATALRADFTGKTKTLRGTLTQLSPANLERGVGAPLAGPAARLEALQERLESVGDELAGRVQRCGAQLAEPWDELLAELEASTTDLEGALTQTRRQLEGSVAALRAELATRRAARPDSTDPLVALEARLGSLEQDAQTSLQALERTAASATQAARDHLARERQAATSAPESVSAELDHTLSSLAARVRALRQQLDQGRSQVAAQLGASQRAVTLQLDQGEESVLAAVDALPAQLEGAERAARQAAARARAAVVQVLAPATAATDALQRQTAPIVRDARQLLVKKQGQVAAQVTEASAAMDGVMERGAGQVRTQIERFEGTAQSALDTLSTALGLIGALRAELLPPLEALNRKLSDLRGRFEQGVDALQSLLAGALSSLDAVPAKNLPKPLVEGALSAIGTAVDTVTPQIERGAAQAGQALSTAAEQITTQVSKTAQRALSQLETVRDRVAKQIDSVLPQVQRQLQTVRQQLDSAVAQLVAQVGTLRDNTVRVIRTGEAQVTQQVTAALDGVDAQLEGARSRVNRAVADAQARVQDAQDRLRDQIERACDQLDAQLAAAEASAAALIERSRRALDEVEERASQRVAALADAIDQRCEELDGRLDALAARCEQSLEGLAAQHERAVATARAALPDPDVIHRHIDALRARLEAALAELRAEGAAV